MKQVFLVATCLLVTCLTSPVKINVGDAWSDAAGYEECPEFVEPGKPLPRAIDDICDVDLECAAKVEMNNTDCGFGMRKVLAGKWVSTLVDDSNGVKKSESFMRLFKYISGANSDGAKIAMTAPVITKVYFDASYNETGSSMHFYIPSAFQANPPSPTNADVYIEDWDEAVVYYRAIGGKSMNIPEKVWVDEFTNLHSAVQTAGHSFYPYMSVVGGFSGPRSRDVRFEVMVVKN